jgi:potassium efflux system protein
MKKVIQHIMNLPVILAFCIIPFTTRAQQPDTARVIPFIPLAEITVQATQVSSLLQEKQNILLRPEQKSTISARIDTLLLKLYLLREDPRIHRLDALSFRNLNNLDNDWTFLHSNLLDEQNQLTEMVQKLENERSSMEGNLSEWNNTLLKASEMSSLEMVIEQVNSIISELEGFMSSLRSDSEFLQERLVQISEGLIFCNTVLGNIKSAQELATKQLLSLKQPPLWKAFAQKTDITIISEQRSLIEDNISDLKDFYMNYSFRIWLHLLLFLIIIGIIYFSFRNLKDFIPEMDIPQADAIIKILKRPVSSAFLINFPLAFIIYETLPDTVRLINTLLLLIPVVLILTDIITGPSRRFIYLLLVAALLVQIHSLSYSDTMISRVFLIAIIIFGLVILGMILWKKSLRQLVLSSRIGKFILVLIWLSVILFALSLFSAIAGAVLLAEFITYATIKSAAIALVFYALAVAMNGIIISSLHSPNIRKLNLIKENYEVIYRRSVNLINLASWVLWLIFTLRFFSVWDHIWKGTKIVLTYSLTIGTVEISLGNILAFLLIVWLTLWISRLIRIIIEGEVTPRVKLKRGVPAAISLILRISVITIGFLIAVGAAGVELSKLAILLGAFGVGIGFGLQNIFNNLISGIIIAFERPINEGDIIEISGFWGTVQKVGIRATTIRTFDGAEVVIPNGNLISNELTNWTLTDQQRRVEVLVGVKYGTDPEQVLKILYDVADAHEETLKDPRPLPLFTEFGESSLNFRLLVWIPDANSRMRIQSELSVAINRELKKAGIEIPFPQRDIHFKSIDESLPNQLLKGKKRE